MNLTNEIRRTRRKVEALQAEGSKQVFNDLLSYLVEIGWKGEVSPEELHKIMATKYRRELEELETKQLKYKQGNINFNNENY